MTRVGGDRATPRQLVVGACVRRRPGDRRRSPSVAASATGGGSATPSGHPRATSAPGSRSTGTRRRLTRAAAKPPAPRERRERRLRRTVRRLRGCLGVLDRRGRRVLVLRAGIGPLPALSRRAVAERLDAGVGRVARSERRALRELRGAARAGRCGGAADTAIVAPAPAGSATDGTPPTPQEPAGGDTAQAVGTAGEGRSGVKDAFRSGPDIRSGGGDSPATLIERVGDDGPPILLAVALAFLAGFGAVWTLQHRGAKRGGTA